MHRAKIQFNGAGIDAVLLEFVLRAMQQFRRFEHRLGRYAAGIQACSTKGILAIFVRPVIDASYRQAMLGRPNGCDISSRSGANDNNIETSAHFLCGPSCNNPD